MISITKLDFFQPIDKKEDIFPSTFQQEQGEFSFAAEILKMATQQISENHAQRTLCFSQYKSSL